MGKNCAIIAAAGKGRRMGTGISKQFLCVKGKPILFYTLDIFSRCSFIDEIIISTSENEIEYCKKEIVDKYKIKKVAGIVPGGKERQESVFNALKSIRDCSIVLIHDGVRPFVNEKIIKDGITYAEIYGASACGVTPKDTIKMKDTDGFSKCTFERSSLFCVQTPQCFKYDLILKAHKEAAIAGLKFTDDTAVAEAYGNRTYLYEGSYGNIKITTPEDLKSAEAMIDVDTY